MGKQRRYKHKTIPTLTTLNDCHDWLDRNKPRTMYVRQWEVWFAWLGKHPYSSVQEGERPVLILSNDQSNRHANTVIVLPFTSQMKRMGLPSHVPVCKINGWDSGRNSLALTEQLTTIDKRRLISKVGEVADIETKNRIAQAVIAHLGFDVGSEHQKGGVYNDQK